MILNDLIELRYKGSDHPIYKKIDDREDPKKEEGEENRET